MPPADDSVETLVASFLRGIEGKPNYAENLVGLAEVVLGRKAKFQAWQLARRALDAADGTPSVVARARAILGSLLPGYHTQMMNDARRNLAWDLALRRAIRPGMHVLEIGTGAGMLAMMAARAGATKVTTCEKDPIAAALALELCRANGFESVVKVIHGTSLELATGKDLDRPADLLFCDIFADNFFGFDPLTVLADARRRLVKPGARVIPAAGSLQLALARWNRSAVRCRATDAAGFDISAFALMTPTHLIVEIGDPGLSLLSPAREAFRFDLVLPSHPLKGCATVSLEAEREGTVDGVAAWIRLDLDDETVLEAKPEPGAGFFSKLMFWPFATSLNVKPGDLLEVHASYLGKSLSIYIG